MNLVAPAKLNLILKIVGKLPNNYHLLEMLNIKIDLEDIIEINESKETCIKYDKYKIAKNEDTIYKTINDFITKYHIPNQNIYIIKNIPVGAGLGGISTDIATIINFLNKKYKLNLTLQELIDFVKPYGTDICYLLTDSPAIVKGVGELIEPISLSKDFKILIINPNIKIETKSIYNKVNNYKPFDLTKEYIEDNQLKNILENDFEEIVFNEYKEIKKLRENLLKYLDNIHMSGSGSTLFSIIENEDDTIRKLKEKYPDYLIEVHNIK